MKSFKICVIGLCFAMANGDTGNVCGKYPTRHETLTSPFYFSYMFEKLNINLIIRLKNASREITSLLITIETDDPGSKSKYKWIGGNEYTICGIEKYSKVTIGLELYSADGLCAVREVSEGRHVKTLENGLADSTYESNHLCALVKNSACVVEMDLRNNCLERKTDPNANRTKSDVTPKRKIAHTPRPTQVTSSARRNDSISQNPTIYYPPKPTQNIPGTVRNTSLTPKIWQKNVTTKPTHKNSNNENKRKHSSITPNHNNHPDTPRSTQGTSGTTRNTSFTTKPTIPKTRQTAQNISNTHQNSSSTTKRKIFTTPKPIQDNQANTSDNSTSKIFVTPKSTIPYTPKGTQNFSDTTRSPHNIPDADNTSVTSDTPEASQNQSDTSNTVEFRINDADINKYITITVISAVSVMALVVLVVVLRKCCWVNHNPVGLSQLPAHGQTSPFYQNMLFRKECDQEIELVEQHHYEEINPQ